MRPDLLTKLLLAGIVLLLGATLLRPTLPVQAQPVASASNFDRFSVSATYDTYAENKTDRAFLTLVIFDKATGQVFFYDTKRDPNAKTVPSSPIGTVGENWEIPLKLYHK